MPYVDLSPTHNVALPSQNILKQTPVPMSPLESLASSAVRTAHKVRGRHEGGRGGQWRQPPFPIPSYSSPPGARFLHHSIYPPPPSNSSPPSIHPQVHASLIVVLTRGGSTARLVAKYRPVVPVLTVAVPVLTTGKCGEGGSIMGEFEVWRESV